VEGRGWVAARAAVEAASEVWVERAAGRQEERME